MNKRYIVPQELKSETQVYKKITIRDFGFILIFFFVMKLFSGCVNSVFELPYQIFNVIVAIILRLSSPVNPKQRIYKSIYFLFIADKSVYHSISYQKDRGIRK